MRWIDALAEDTEKWNNWIGWGVFTIALVVYSLTVEPTGSFWDCGEYISTSAKLQVGHPPGAPLFQMIGAFFALFAFGNEMKIALMVNYMSVVSSAFAILFTFWIITNLLTKLWIAEEGASADWNGYKSLVIFGSGVVGSLALCFSDSFWFNAGETEVYSMASFMMALLLWLGLKWVDHMHEERGHRWLLLISFVVGLVFGIQFMGFLAIPSIGLLYFFKKYPEFTLKQFLLANAVVIALLFLVYKYSLTYVLKIFGWGEVFFINQVGMPFNSGTIIVGLAFAGLFYWAIRYTRQKNYPIASLIVHCVLFLFMGFSCWLMLPIRANAMTVVNENNPEDARSLLAYYNREQYPGVESPVYGSYYSDQFSSADKPRKDDKPKYEKDFKKGKYVIVNDYKDALQGSDPDHVGLLPRMWSGSHAENYMTYFGRLDFDIKREYMGNPEIRRGRNRIKELRDDPRITAAEYIRVLNDARDYIVVKPPSLADNIRYLLDFQWGYMYVRYFMWNFAGRQNDRQGRYDENGKWLSGISFIDKSLAGPQKNLPSDMKNNKARNTYFFLPLILGIIGLVYQAKNQPRMFWTLLVFFLFTGLAIQFYTNPYLFQPRERDYSLVGSFFIFCIWIGMGVFALFRYAGAFLRDRIAAPSAVLLCVSAVPLLMAVQNWDDHDRSGRETARSTAMSYLDSCQEDAGAMLFTIGDNDTFPLWYAQEIEGFRTDVRVINTSLFATDWYIDQMKRQAYNSPPIPSALTHDHYKFGTRDLLYYQAVPGMEDQRWDIKEFMEWVKSDRPQTRLKFLFDRQNYDTSDWPESDLNIVYYPTRKIRVPVNKENALSSGLVRPEDADKMVDYIDFELPSVLTKNRLLMLDILAENDWKRPIYFSGGSFDNAEYLWMKDYLQLDGLVYKLIPIYTERKSSFEMGRIDSDLMYDIVMRWEWGNSGDLDIYHDPQTRSQGISFRSNLARLTEQLIEEGKTDKAARVIDLAMTHIPVEPFGFYPFLEPFLDGYFKVGKREEGLALFDKLKNIYQERIAFYQSMDKTEQEDRIEDIFSEIQNYVRIVEILTANNEVERAEQENTLLNQEYIPFLEDLLGYDPGVEVEQELPLPAEDSLKVRDSIPESPDSSSAESAGQAASDTVNI